MKKPLKAGTQKTVAPATTTLVTKGILTNPQNAQKPREVWLDGQDVMLWLHICPRTLQTWRTEQILPYHRVMKKIWYKQSEVDKMLEQHLVVRKKGEEL